MNILICGAGEVGRHAAHVLGADGSDITIVDKDQGKLTALEDTLDVRTMVGNGAQAEVLQEAGCDKADLFLAATKMDEINLLAASVAKAVGARICVARAHHIAYFDEYGLGYRQHLGIDHLMCPEFSTAVAIAQTLRSPGALAIEQFARGRIEMQALPVSDGASAIGKALADLKMPASTRIVAIDRGGESFIPESSSVVQRGDVVMLVGDAEQFDKAVKLFLTAAGRRRRIMIMGGSSLGVWLSRTLRGHNFSIRLFEPHAKRAAELAAKLDWITVLAADPTDPDTLREEKIDQVDSFVAVTDDDERNMLSAAHAKSMGAKSAIAVQQRTTYLHLLEHIGIDKAFSPQIAAIHEVQLLLNQSPVRRLASVSENVADVYEVKVPVAATQVIACPLRELLLPAKTLVTAIQRNGKVFVPSASDAISSGDTVVLVAPSGFEEKIKKLFSIK